MLKLIIFDWDDVITLGSKEGYFACYDAALKEVGVELPLEEKTKRILERWGQPFPKELELLLAEHPEKLEQACASFESNFAGDTFFNELTMVPGALEVLARLATKYTLAVATGNRPDMLQRIFTKFSVPESLFLKVYSSHEVAPEYVKPHPYMLLDLMKMAGVLPEETVFVGDAKSDVIMANNAKVKPIVVLTGHLNREQAVELGVKDIINSVADIETVI